MRISKQVSNWLVILSIIFFMGSLTSCSSMKGHSAWFENASEVEKSEFLQQKSLEKLEAGWAKFYDNPIIRRSVSVELERRGLDGQLFFDPASDNKRRAQDQATARDFAQALSAGLQAVNQQNLAGPGAGTTYQNTATALSRSQAVAVFGSQNITYRKVGNTTYGSDGTIYRKSGNTTYGSDGTSYRQSGNTTYGSDGTSYRKSGNTTYGSDGTTYRQSGNTFYGSDGTNCRAIGNTIYCN